MLLSEPVSKPQKPGVIMGALDTKTVTPGQQKITDTTEEADEMAERRYAINQALASTRIEGHVPSAEYLEDVEAYVAGTMTLDEMGERSLIRAKALEAANLKARKSEGAT